MSNPAGTETERIAEKRSYTRQGALFADHVLTLGADGFAKWLTDSFGGADPGPRAGWFHYDDDTLFSDAFAEVVPEFGQELLKIAGEGVRTAVGGFDPRQGTYIGLYILTALAETLEVTEAVPDLAKNFEAWLPSRGAASKPPETIGQIVALRETLECCFRLLLNSIDAARKSRRAVGWTTLTDFKALCSWSRDILRNRSDWRTLTPARAPLYFLALTSAALGNEASEIVTYDSRLKNGDWIEGAPFETLYSFESSAIPKALYPYNLDNILSKKEQFLQRLGSGILNSEIRIIIRKDDPIKRSATSATQGNIPFPTESEKNLNALLIWDDYCCIEIPSGDLFHERQSI